MIIFPGSSGLIKEIRPHVQITSPKGKVANVKYKESAEDSKLTPDGSGCVSECSGEKTLSALGSEVSEVDEFCFLDK